MSATREAKPSEGRLRARRKAEARRARPSARSEARHVMQRISQTDRRGRPKGPSARDFDEADTQTRTSGVWSREAEE
jgi:hypothetical protein